MTEYEYQTCPDSRIELQIRAMMGRNAFYKRNNIFVDLKDNIISFSGCNLMIMQQDGKGVQQSLLKPDVLFVSSHPEISCMALGDAKRLLIVGSNEEAAKLIAWDISTNSPLYQISLPGFVSVQLLKISPTERAATAIVMTRSGQKYLLFVDLNSKKVKAVHHFYKPILINDMSFLPSRDSYITLCGVNYMAEWRYQNQTLI